jgi:hypothetical protein
MKKPMQTKIKYLNNSEYTLISNPKKTTQGLIFVGYKHGNLRKTKRDINTSSAHRQKNRIYNSKGVHPTICSRTRNCFILLDSSF